MHFRLFLLLMLFVPVSIVAQSELTIQTEEELATALARNPQDRLSRESLLKSHSGLVNARLWGYLTKQAGFQASEQSLETYKVAIQVANQLTDQKLLAKAYYGLGYAYSDLNQFSKAIESYEEARDHFERAGLQRDLVYVLADLGALYLLQEDYAKARQYSEQSISLAAKVKGMDIPAGTWPDDFGKSRALYTLAVIDQRDGNHAEAIEKLQAALAIHRTLNGSGSSYNSLIADDLAALNRVYADSGDYIHALSYANQAFKIAKTLSDPETMAGLFNTIGFLYMEQEDYDQAKAQFNESLKLYTELKNERETAKVLLNLGVVEQRQNHYDEALPLFTRSANAATATQFKDVQIAANEGIGVVLTAKRDFTAAQQALDQSLALAREIKDKTRQTEILWRSAQLHFEMGDYGRSSSLAENAVSLARESHLPKLAYLAATTLGQSYASEKKVPFAIRTLTQAVEQIEANRYQVAGTEQERQLFFEDKLTAYDALVDLLIKQGRAVDALLYAERSKGRVLLDVLSSGKPDSANVLTPAEKEEAQRLNRKISEINDRVKRQESANSSSLNSLYAQLDSARLEYQSFQDALYVAHPNLRTRSGRTALLTTADVDGLTQNKDTGYLEYVVGKDRVSLFVLTKDKTGASDVKVYSLAIKPDDLVRKVNEFHDTLAEQRPAYANAAHELYTLLIAPAEQQLRNVGNVCIVPDSFLWNVPFQALMTPSEHFLIEDHAVYYAPSLSVLREMNRKKAASEKTDSSLIAFGNPVIGRDQQRSADLCPLPEAEQEVSSIATSFGSKVSKVFIGCDASEKTFKALAPNYSIIHLATHGVIDNRRPLYSHLLLTKTEGDLENDGRLEARQIMDMNLHADLAVLSACETANGKIAPGEGVIGMSWAFFVAGTHSLVVSQWKVSSACTSDLMINFYQALAPDRNQSNWEKAKALRIATLRLMKEGRCRHPFYWASFVSIGQQ